LQKGLCLQNCKQLQWEEMERRLVYLERLWVGQLAGLGEFYPLLS
jgi:hypothetical protein